MNPLPLTRLLCRMQPVEGTAFIFTCNKDGLLPVTADKVIPIGSLYFIINPNYAVSYSSIENKYYKEIFIFEHLLDNLPTERSEVRTYKRRVLDFSKNNDLFAKTYTSEYTYFDNEKLLEWVPGKDNILAPIQAIKPNIRRDLGLPYPFEENDDSIFKFSDNLIFFRNVTGRYNFVALTKKTIVVRHYYVDDDRSRVALRFYAEINYNSDYVCKFNLDENECLLIGRDTIIGYPNLQTIQEKIYGLDHNKYIKILKDNNMGFTYSAYQKAKIKQREAMGLDKLNVVSMDDEDGGDFFRYGDFTGNSYEDMFYN